MCQGHHLARLPRLAVKRGDRHGEHASEGLELLSRYGLATGERVGDVARRAPPSGRDFGKADIGPLAGSSHAQGKL